MEDRSTVARYLFDGEAVYKTFVKLKPKKESKSVTTKSESIVLWHISLSRTSHMLLSFTHYFFSHFFSSSVSIVRNTFAQVFTGTRRPIQCQVYLRPHLSACWHAYFERLTSIALIRSSDESKPYEMKSFFLSPNRTTQGPTNPWVCQRLPLTLKAAPALIVFIIFYLFHFANMIEV